MHGKTSVITTTQQGVFAGLPEKFTVNRYHSLDRARHLPESAGGHRHQRPKTAKSWACATKRWRIEGVQFHPESILTEHGHAMLRNFLEQRHAEPQHLLLFIAAGLLLNLTPGPDVMYIVANALRAGAARAWWRRWGSPGCWCTCWQRRWACRRCWRPAATAFTCSSGWARLSGVGGRADAALGPRMRGASATP
jgi:hypothetical protein